MMLVICLAQLLMLPMFVIARLNCSNDTEIVGHLLYNRAATYNRNILPSYPVSVRIEMWIQEVSSVSELTQDFEIDLYMNEFWEDPALNYEFLQPCNGNLSFDSTIQEKIWSARTSFVNSKKAQMHSSPFRNVFLMIFPNGSIWSCWRIKSTGPCNVDLTRFPMDFLSCYLTFESYSYNMYQVQMRWNDPLPVQLFKDIELPDFSMVNYSIQNVHKMYAAGMWDELMISFIFKRRYGWYFLQGYIPTYLTVFISWIAFYLGPKAIAPRTMIGVNAMLAQTFQFGNIMRNLPRVSYIKAIDVWMLSGMGFIFASLIQLALIGFISSQEDNNQQRSKLLKQVQLRLKKRERKKPAVSSETLDYWSRIAFPASYSIFNLAYWGYYMSDTFFENV